MRDRKTITQSVSFAHDVHHAIRVIVEREDRSFSYIVNRTIRSGLRMIPPKPRPRKQQKASQP